MKNAKNAPRTTATMLLAITMTGAGLTTTALAASRVKTKQGAAFVSGAAEQKATSLAKDWQMKSKAVSFDSMYAR